MAVYEPGNLSHGMQDLLVPCWTSLEWKDMSAVSATTTPQSAVVCFSCFNGLGQVGGVQGVQT